MNITFATLFVCDGLYSRDDFVRWHAPFSAEPVVLIIAGGCAFSTRQFPNVAVRRIRKPSRTYNTLSPSYRFLRAKFEIWKLRYERVIYYDIDIFVKPPVRRCAHLCTGSFCAVRDPVAAMILGIRGQPYFNTGFMVISPSQQIYNDLMATEQHGPHFADQDTLNEYFKYRWQKLPKACNWLHYKENHPTAVTDPRVFAVHKL